MVQNFETRSLGFQAYVKNRQLEEMIAEKSALSMNLARMIAHKPEGGITF